MRPVALGKTARDDLVRLVFVVLIVLASSRSIAISAQVSQKPQSAPANSVAVVSGEPAELRYLNRPITVFRASILSRSPAERAAAAAANIDRLVKQGSPGAVSTRRVLDMVVISIGTRDVFMLTPQDVDVLSDETLDGKVSEAVSNLEQALAEAVELHTTRRMLTNVGQALVGTVVFALLLWGAKRMHRRLGVLLPEVVERQLAKLAPGELLVQESRATRLLGRGLDLAFALVAIVLSFSWLTFSFRCFPYSRPWGESLRTFLLSRVGAFGLQVIQALPDLFMVALIVLVTRFLVRFCDHLFQAVEEKRIEIPGLYPETAYASRRLVSIVLWLLAIVVAYPYVPGSHSDVFKGLSVFIGLVVSLGSSGIVNQLMSGLLITYSRAVRMGDFVKIGKIEGTVIQIGALSTKVKTPRGEDVTIPNAVVVTDVIQNYSRFADSEGVYVPTVVNIGYDTPWRQVQALLLLAAERTPDICQRPKPVVRQTALGDFCVEYTLLVCLDKPQLRGPTLSALHANILDAFNDRGVQIMTPHYEADPETTKLVPRARWYSSPAISPTSAEPTKQPATTSEGKW